MADQRPEEAAGVSTADLSEQVVLVTGATDGVGRETALALARLGATVVAHGRSPSKARSLERDLDTTGADTEVVTADFVDLDQVHDLADHVESEYDRLDVLVNNAGAFFDEGSLTDEGVERTIAVNHLAPFVLTTRLRSSIEASDGRVVTTSSDVHRRADFDFDALESVGDFDGLRAYGLSKFANVLFTYELARQFEDATANCFHPGFIPGSGLYRNGSLPIRFFMGALDALPRGLTSRIVSSSADGAATAVYLAISDAVAGATGGYYDDMELVETAPGTHDETAQQRLWEWSESVTGLDAEWTQA